MNHNNQLVSKDSFNPITIYKLLRFRFRLVIMQLPILCQKKRMKKKNNSKIKQKIALTVLFAMQNRRTPEIRNVTIGKCVCESNRIHPTHLPQPRKTHPKYSGSKLDARIAAHSIISAQDSYNRVFVSLSCHVTAIIQKKKNSNNSSTRKKQHRNEPA